MKRQIVKFGPNAVLPLLNHVVTGLHFDEGCVTLIFEKDAHTERPKVTLSENLCFTDTEGQANSYSLEDNTEHMRALGILLSLMWTEVVSSHVDAQGCLSLGFSNGCQLVAQTVHWQGWAYHGYGELLEGRCGRWVG